MLKEISWNSYWVFIAYSLVGYYCFVLAKYDLKAKLAKLSEKRTVWARQEPGAEESGVAHSSDPVQTDDDFLHPAPDSDEFKVYACVDEVSAYLENARSRKTDKAELMSALQQIFSKYPSIKETEYQESLSNVIITQCAHLCFIHLTDADMSRVWQG